MTKPVKPHKRKKVPLNKSERMPVFMTGARWRAVCAILLTSQTMMNSDLHKYLAMDLYEDIAKQTGVDTDPIDLKENDE